MSEAAALQESAEWMTYLRAIFALLFVVALIYLSSAAARKYGLDKRLAGAKPQQQTTLSLSETLYLDPRRRIVKVREGSKIHLLLLGPNNDVHIATQASEAAHDLPQ